jgi:hypothetical protein
MLQEIDADIKILVLSVFIEDCANISYLQISAICIFSFPLNFNISTLLINVSDNGNCGRGALQVQ